MMMKVKEAVLVEQIVSQEEYAGILLNKICQLVGNLQKLPTTCLKDESGSLEMLRDDFSELTQKAKTNSCNILI